MRQADEEIHSSIQSHVRWLAETLAEIYDDLETRIKRSRSWLRKNSLLKSVPSVPTLATYMVTDISCRDFTNVGTLLNCCRA